ncbi:MAG: hypothetical protein HY902_08360 [Deltaproteobacteria bacterium]|nr:hypothetical protein [Deltaproteobacteria bacterium]
MQPHPQHPTEPPVLPARAPHRLRAWPRLLLLVAVAAATLYCSGAPQRRSSRTLVTVSGGYAQAIQNHYGCGGELISSETQLQAGGSAEVVHENEVGWMAGVEVGAQRSEVQEVRNSGQIAMEGTSERPLATYWQRAATVRLGWDLHYFGFDGGASFYTQGGAISPYLAIRGGSVRSGFYAELQGGSRHPLWDSTLVSAGVHFRDERFRAGLSLASTARRMLTHRVNGGQLRTEGYQWGSVLNGGDPAVIGYAEVWPQSNAAIRFTGVGAETWGATISLILGLGGDPEPEEPEWRGRATPLPDAPPEPLPPEATPAGR